MTNNSVPARKRIVIPAAAWLRACPVGERFNTLSHLLALALAVGGGSWLVFDSLASAEPRKVAGAVVFGVCMVLLYAASVLFHGSTGLRKEVWQRADHATIFILIVGTCTPFALAGPSGRWQVPLLLAMWLLAGCAVVRELRSPASSQPPLMLYIAMGWLGVAGATPAAAAQPGAALGWLLAGALSYSAGTLFYRNPRGWPHAHGVWHLFVLAGTASHFLAVRQLLA